MPRQMPGPIRRTNWQVSSVIARPAGPWQSVLFPSPTGTGGASHRAGCGLPRRFAPRNDSGSRRMIVLIGFCGQLGWSAWAAPRALPCGLLFSHTPPKPGQTSPERWNGYDDRLCIGCGGTIQSRTRGGGQTLRPGPLRRTASDGAGSRGCIRRRGGCADGGGGSIPTLSGSARRCGSIGRGGKKWLTKPPVCGNMKQYNPTKGYEGKSNRTEPDREPGQLETGRGRAANMVPEPECR